MQNHRIKELREAKGWSQEQLADAVSLSRTAITKLENGGKRLRADEVQRIAEALEVDVAEVLGRDAKAADPHKLSTGFADDITAYQAEAGDPFLGLQTEHRYLLKVETNVLSKVGISKADLVVVDASAAAVKRLKPLDLVRVQYHPDSNDPARAVALLRQFVPPSLLITNSGQRNEPTLDIDSDDVQILGIIVSVHRALQH